MSSKEIRSKFLKFFEARGHAVVPSSSLVPDDPSVLLTTAGMQQFKPYFTGELDPMKDFGSKNTASVQKSFRTSDIDEVGDKSHLTFFEMLGNFSFGGYFKKEAIAFAIEFLEKELGISHARITATYFGGDEGGSSTSSETKNIVPEQSRGTTLPADEESRLELKKYFQDSKISAHGREDNFWGPTGNEGPCGPTVEFYVDGIEVWNLVFNEYYCSSRHPERSEGSQRDSSPTTKVGTQNDNVLEPLKTKGVDTGMGLERLVVMMQGVDTVFETDLFEPLIKKINELKPELEDRVVRVLADHLRGAIFLAADGVRPSNKEAGYILRRLLRRVLAYKIVYDIHDDLIVGAFEAVSKKFGDVYPEVKDPRILEVLEAEKDKFEKAVANGVGELKNYKEIGAKEAFYLYESFGLPFEVIKELASEASKNLKRDDFDKEFEKHQEISRAGMEKKFGGHGLLLNTGELKAKDEEELKKVTRLHTATHLLQAALRKILGDEVKQMGSDITAERTRFDFTFPRKLTPEEIKKVEDLVNEVVQKDLPVQFKEMPKEEAEKTGALFFFKQKYPEKVKVYYAGHSLEDAFSKEFCGGPHVSHTLEIGKFKIAKEEAVGSGTRRIRGIIE